MLLFKTVSLMHLNKCTNEGVAALQNPAQKLTPLKLSSRLELSITEDTQLTNELRRLAAKERAEFWSVEDCEKYARELNEVPGALDGALIEIKAKFLEKGKHNIVEIGAGSRVFFPEGLTEDGKSWAIEIKNTKYLKSKYRKEKVKILKGLANLEGLLKIPETERASTGIFMQNVLDIMLATPDLITQFLKEAQSLGFTYIIATNFYMPEVPIIERLLIEEESEKNPQPKIRTVLIGESECLGFEITKQERGSKKLSREEYIKTYEKNYHVTSQLMRTGYKPKPNDPKKNEIITIYGKYKDLIEKAAKGIRVTLSEEIYLNTIPESRESKSISGVTGAIQNIETIKILEEEIKERLNKEPLNEEEKRALNEPGNLAIKIDKRDREKRTVLVHLKSKSGVKKFRITRNAPFPESQEVLQFGMAEFHL
ncbi:hypothetical protein DID77_01780 [Candidatus Marinamargulisbacteria bacterium SCGC AG-439-L15]|nr:hypothetical protein DID77_01780 [Candidatus Marinamargulisbacteria bacterium SCGC AG-439-L15]